MARRNIISNKSGELTIDPGASGDSWLQYSNSGGSMFRTGVDDGSGDAYKISDGGALGTTDRFVVSAAGDITMPVQSSFLNVVNAEANVTGDGTGAGMGAVAATTSVFDRNSDMTEGDGAGTAAIFTAPVTGNYQFFFTVIYDVPAASGTVQIRLTFHNIASACILPTIERVAGFAGAGNDVCMSVSGFLAMTASDTIQFNLQADSGTKTTDVVSGFIGGYLVG